MLQRCHSNRLQNVGSTPTYSTQGDDGNALLQIEHPKKFFKKVLTKLSECAILNI